MKYGYDAAGRVTGLNENGAATGLSDLVEIAYDNLGRRDHLDRGNGTSTSYGYNPGSRLTSLAQAMAGTAYDVSEGFTYNWAGQALTHTLDNTAYVWLRHPPGTVAATYDGLNRDAAIAATAGGYGPRGNLTDDGDRTFTYDGDYGFLNAYFMTVWMTVF